jgi:hypothetical protein
MAAQNKRILCFIDECGTAGEPGFALGCVMAWARECGRADKSLSDLLEPNANELHAANLSREYLQSLLARYAQTDRPEGMIVNGGVKFGHCGGAKVGQFGASALERAALI